MCPDHPKQVLQTTSTSASSQTTTSPLSPLLQVCGSATRSSFLLGPPVREPRNLWSLTWALRLWTLEVESSCDPSVPTGSRSSKNRVGPGQGWAEPGTPVPVYLCLGLWTLRLRRTTQAFGLWNSRRTCKEDWPDSTENIEFQSSLDWNSWW